MLRILSSSTLSTALLAFTAAHASQLRYQRDFAPIEPLMTSEGGEIHVSFEAYGRFFDIVAARNEKLIYRDTKLDHCHYQGKITDDPDSIVAISTCNREFVGLIKTDGETFYLDPMSHTNLPIPDRHRVEASHVLMRHAPVHQAIQALAAGKSGKGSPCAVDVPVVDAPNTKPGDATVAKATLKAERESSCEGSDSRLVRVLIVNNAARVKQFGARGAEERSLSLVNIADTYYAKTPFTECWRLTVADQLTFETNDPVRYRACSTNDPNVGTAGCYSCDRGRCSLSSSSKDEYDIDEMLTSLASWRGREIGSDGRFDLVQMLTSNALAGGTIGYAYVGTVCEENRDVGIVEDKGLSVGYIGNILAHEIGHVLGLPHASVGIMVPSSNEGSFAETFGEHSRKLLDANPPYCISAGSGSSSALIIILIILISVTVLRVLFS